jgi:Cd2+/Zn2+-exporting ATPase
VPLAFFGGIGSAASLGILFKGGSSFSPLSKIRNIAFDKTGTLTSGNFKVGKVKAFGIDEAELLSLTAAVEKSSSHPIAKALSTYEGSDIRAFDITELAGMGTVGTVGGLRIAVGNEKLALKEGAIIPSEVKIGT